MMDSILSAPIAGTPYHLEHEHDGWVVMLGDLQVDGPYPLWTQGWIAAQELER